MPSSLYEQIYSIVKRIPKGKVATYGDIASVLGNPKLARVVGNALHINPYKGVVPCHRVVNRDGKLAVNFGFGGLEGQRELLEKEGVKIEDNMVKLNIFGWKR